MGEARGADTAPIWPIGPVTVDVKEEVVCSSQMPAMRNSRHQIDGHLSFGSFDGCVRLSWGYGVSFREDL
jgi:hypothetical protein